MPDWNTYVDEQDFNEQSVLEKLKNTPWQNKDLATVVGVLIQAISMFDGRSIQATLLQNSIYLLTQETAYQLTTPKVEIEESDLFRTMWNDYNFAQKFNDTRHAVGQSMSAGVTLSLWVLIANIIYKSFSGLPAPFSAESTNVFVNNHFEQAEQVEWQLASNNMYFNLNVYIALAMPVIATLLKLLTDLCQHKKIDVVKSLQTILVPLLLLSFVAGALYGVTHESVTHLGVTDRPYMFNDHNITKYDNSTEIVTTVNQEFIDLFNEKATSWQKINNNYHLEAAQAKDEHTNEFSGHTFTTMLAVNLAVLNLKALLSANHFAAGYAAFVLSVAAGVLEGLCRNIGQAHSFGATIDAILMETLCMIIALQLMPQVEKFLAKVYENPRLSYDEFMNILREISQRPDLIVADTAGFVAGLVTTPIKNSCEAGREFVYYLADKPLLWRNAEEVNVKALEKSILSDQDSNDLEVGTGNPLK